MSRNVKLFTPHTAQKRVIDGFADTKHKFGVFVAPRQIGKSVLGMNLMLYWLLTNEKQEGCWISPIFAQARKVHQELSDKANSLISASNKAEFTITFINGSKLRFLSGDSPDSIRGYSFNYIIVDEAAYVKPEAINQAILPTLNAIGKKCLFISTPRGKNHFYDWYVKGTVDNGTYISFRAKSTENPYADHEFINEQKSTLPISIYKAEYEGEFTDASADVFRGLDNVCILNNYEPANKSKRCFIGIDTGLQNDYSALCIIDEQGRVQYMERTNGENITSIADKFVQILSRYHIVGGYIETNGIGRAMYDLVNPRYRKVMPFTTTQDSKTTMVRKLIEDIEAQTLELPSQELFPPLYNELSQYTYKMSNNGKLSFSHPNGAHDDTVDALLMANEARHNIKTQSIYIGGSKNQINVNFGVK